MVWKPPAPPPPPEPTHRIPKLTKAELTRRSRLIRPVFHQGRKLFYQKVSGLDANLAHAEPDGEAIGLRKIKSIRMLQKIRGYHQFLTCTAAEALCQIPEELLERVAAYELIGPSDVDDLNREIEAFNAGFFVYEAILYSVDKEAVRKEELRPKTPLAKALLGDDDPFENL